MSLASLAIRAGWLAGALTVSVLALHGQDAIDKDAFLSRKKWYASFTVRLKGVGEINKPDKKGDGYDKLEWNILREVTGVIELGVAMPGQPTFSHTPKDGAAYMEKGRFIGWNFTPPADFKVDPAAFFRGQFKVVTSPMSVPVTYTVNDTLTSESLSYGEAHFSLKVSDVTKIKGGGLAYMNRSGLMVCDLKEMMFDLSMEGLRAAAGGFKADLAGVNTYRVSHSLEQSLGTDEVREYPVKTDKPDIFLPAMTETLKQKLLWRKLEITKGKIAFSVSEPVANLPFGFEQPKRGGPPLQLSIDFELSPTPPSKAKFVLKPRDYENWRPMCADSEDKKGNTLWVDWSVDEEGGDPANPLKVNRVVFSLVNTSKEPGVCMNYPVHPKIPADFDLKFEIPISRRDGYNRASDGQKVTLTDSQAHAGGGCVRVDCFDSGATGMLMAEADLEDGRTLTGMVKGSGGGSQLMIPDFEPGVSWIARSWRAQNAPGKKDDADDENFPVGDGQKGDGLTVWEEYRGFWVGGQWEGCDPQTKDLFIFNGIGGDAQKGLTKFGEITSLRVHDKLEYGEFKVDRVVNFNKGARPHLVDQHCLTLLEGGDVGPATSVSICRTVDGASFPGPPKNTLQVSILSVVIGGIVPIEQSRPGEVYSVAEADATICHELGHALGIRHHGDKDHGMLPWTYRRKDDGELVTYAEGAVVKVWNEATSTLMVPSELFPGLNPGEEKLVWIGERNGQHGGDEACVMRYDISRAYRSQAAPGNLYYIEGNEIVGTRLCTSPAGTGSNMPTHIPQSRYFGADKDRGDCAHKFVVSDRWEKIH